MTFEHVGALGREPMTHLDRLVEQAGAEYQVHQPRDGSLAGMCLHPPGLQEIVQKGYL